MKIINMANGEIVAEILTNHSVTLDEALEIAGAEVVEQKYIDDPTHRLNGKDLWSEELYIEA